jgi:hypothetical protein
MNAIAEKAAYYARMAQYASDGFSQVYLGAKDVAPTADNNGNPLIEGALYFNTVTELLYAWDGAAWVSAIVGTNTATTDTAQTITGVKTFTQPIVGNLTGDVSGNAGTATILQTARTIGISGSVTGTATSFNGSANITIPTTITTGATITSPNLAGTPTYVAGFDGFLSKYIKGITDGLPPTAGYIGQTISNTSILTTIASNAIVYGAQITLTPGCWEVYGNATFNFNTVTAASGDFLGASISSLNPITPALVDTQRQILLVPALSACTQTPAYAFVTPRVRFDVTTNSSVYIVIQAPTTSVGTMQFSSIITANRVR